jgi:hypothetical protein
VYENENVEAIFELLASCTGLVVLEIIVKLEISIINTFKEGMCAHVLLAFYV